MMDMATISPARTEDSAAKCWLRALELTAPISQNRDRIFSTVIEEMAERCGDAPALLSDRECFTYGELAERANRYARWALEQGIAKGDVVGLSMTNRPEYLAIWLGIASIGGVVALLNTNLSGPSLAHCIETVSPAHIIVSSEFSSSLAAVSPGLSGSTQIWIHGAEDDRFQRIDDRVLRYSGDKLCEAERPRMTIEDRALYIFTSGTTGLPKAANISHARILQWCYWFAGMMNAQPSDRMYNCLPMYHSIGGVLVPGAVLVTGASAVIREKFSATHFWADVIRWDCTMFQYIGEFCRYLLLAHRTPERQNHRIRLACGNGLSPDVWEDFKDRFGIPRIVEFYASTEGGVSLFNAEGKKGSIGRVPPYLTHRYSPALVRFDVETGNPIRDADGLCVRCTPDETGEALGKIVDGPSSVGSRFEGYTDKQASEKKILRDVFAAGDAWVRTGDLMRKDAKGFYYFVDRVGDTFRWKGENVSTSEVSAAICGFPGVLHANVYGVNIPFNDGRACMAALVAENGLDLRALRLYLRTRLPSYASPVFLRLQGEMAMTGTFKYSKTELVKQGYDPGASTDAIYFDDSESGEFVRFGPELYSRVQAGKIRL